jgi:hypothetical protein
MFRLLFLLIVGFAVGIVFTFGFFIKGWEAPSWKENMLLGYEELKKETFLLFTDKVADSTVGTLGKVLGGGEVNEKNFLESLLKRSTEKELLLVKSLPLVKDPDLKKALEESLKETKKIKEEGVLLYGKTFSTPYNEGLYKYTASLPNLPAPVASSSLSLGSSIATSLILYNKNYILLSNQIIAYTDNGEVKALAEKVLTIKTKEIDFLKSFLVK